MKKYELTEGDVVALIGLAADAVILQSPKKSLLDEM